MSAEFDFIESLRSLAMTPGARALLDDAAVLEVGGARLVLTHDMIVEGVHFLAGDPPQDVAWKLVAVNLSDLAAKGARPLGALLGYTLAGDAQWDAAFVAGLGAALDHFGLALLGGDTVALPRPAPRSLGLTGVGEASGPVPSRAGARAGDDLWVTGSIGDAGAGLAVALERLARDSALLERYRRPRPRLVAGQALAPIVTAMMDVSDGLLIDAARMAGASGLAVSVELGSIPLSPEYAAAVGSGLDARIAASTSGDDYELLFAAAPADGPAVASACAALALPLARIGRFSEGSGLRLAHSGMPVPLPARLGYQHGGGVNSL